MRHFQPTDTPVTYVLRRWVKALEDPAVLDQIGRMGGWYVVAKGTKPAQPVERGLARARVGASRAAKPPRVVLRRARAEVTVRTERYRGPARARRLDQSALLAALGERLAGRMLGAPAGTALLRRRCRRGGRSSASPPVRATGCSRGAERAAVRELDLLGTGPFRLGTPADWHTDVDRKRRGDPPGGDRSTTRNSTDRVTSRCRGRSRACSGCCRRPGLPARPGRAPCLCRPRHDRRMARRKSRTARA